MRVTLIDSPVANVANIARALRSAGADLDVTRDAGAVSGGRRTEVENAPGSIFPPGNSHSPSR